MIENFYCPLDVFLGLLMVRGKFQLQFLQDEVIENKGYKWARTDVRRRGIVHFNLGEIIFHLK